VFFPVGMRLRGVSKRFRDYGPELCGRGEQTTYFRRTAGHQQVLHSHRLSVESLGDAATPVPLREVRMEYDPETRQQVFTATGARLRYRIRSNPLSWNDTPYWIMQVPPQVLPDHARIFSREVLELGGMLLEMSGALSDHRARLVRDDRVKPILMVAGHDGGMRFLDRSQRIYAIDRATQEAVFVSCMPRSLSGAQDVVGIGAAEQGTWLVGSMSASTAPERRRRMGIARFSAASDGSWPEEVQELRRGSLYEAAAFDFERQLVFLARRGAPSLEVAELARRDIGPAPLLELGTTVSQIALLAYDAGRRHLFASDGLATLLAIDLDAAPARVQVVASDLDQPSALAFDGERRRLYVATSGDGALWKLECATECSAPVRFASAPALRRPRTLAVDARGVVWAGDLENEVIVGFSPAGRLVQQVERLPSSF
jgi:SMP-30/Gluconolactonase/LRE-like region